MATVTEVEELRREVQELRREVAKLRRQNDWREALAKLQAGFASLSQEDRDLYEECLREARESSGRVDSD